MLKREQNGTSHMLKFAKAYIKSMRLYYAFVTGIAGWIGVSFYEYRSAVLPPGEQPAPSLEKKTLILAMLFLGWGLNQIFNDYLGLKEDRVNAPERPMVTGELNPKAALALSGALLALASAAAAFWLEPVSLAPLWAGILLNIVYEFAKAYGLWANLVFGVMISMCSIFGFLACGEYAGPLFTVNRVAIILLVVLMNGLMTYYTYFKDYEGDLAAGKRTTIAVVGPDAAKWIGAALTLLPAAVFAAFYLRGIWPDGLSRTFWLLAALTFFLEIWTAVLYCLNPRGEKTFFSLATNFRACACGQAALVAVFAPGLGLVLFLVTYIFVGFLFDMHRNSKA